MGRKLIKGVNDIQSRFPVIASYFDTVKNGCMAEDVCYSSNKQYWWTCDKDHSFQMPPNRRIRREYSCPYCSGQILLRGFNDLETVYPDIAKEWDFSLNKGSPDDYMYGSGYKAWWICGKCQNSYQSNINIHIRGHKCPCCSGLTVKNGFNDLETLFPSIATEYDNNKNDIKSWEVSPYSHKKAWWICSICGKSYYSQIKHRVYGVSCPLCKQSSGEQFVMQTLLKYNINFKSQGWFADCRDIKPLRFDFLIYDNDDKWVGVIKYNGKQHYVPVEHYKGTSKTAEEALSVREYHEMLKRCYCHSKGVSFCVIPYASTLNPVQEIEKYLINLGLIDRR